MATPSWFDFKVTLGNILTVLAMVITVIGVYTNLRLDVQASVVKIEAVQEQVRALDNDQLPTRLTVLENSILIKSAARDKQIEAITSLQSDQGSKIDRLIEAVAALTATLKARNNEP